MAATQSVLCCWARVQEVILHRLPPSLPIYLASNLDSKSATHLCRLVVHMLTLLTCADVTHKQGCITISGVMDCADKVCAVCCN